MNLALRSGSILFALAAVALVGLGVAESRRPRIDPSQWLQVDSQTKSFGVAAERTILSVEFTLRNVGERPIRILGSSSSCAREGCVRLLRSTHEIAPGGSKTIVVDVAATKAGTLSTDLRLFTDCPGKTDFPLTVTGTVLKVDASGIFEPTVL